jgi:hypothetical protein
LLLSVPLVLLLLSLSPLSPTFQFSFLSQSLCLWHASTRHRPCRDLQPAITHTFIFHNVLKPQC